MVDDSAHCVLPTHRFFRGGARAIRRSSSVQPVWLAGGECKTPRGDFAGGSVGAAAARCYSDVRRTTQCPIVRRARL